MKTYIHTKTFYLHIHTYINTYIHTYIHTYIQKYIKSIETNKKIERNELRPTLISKNILKILAVASTHRTHKWWVKVIF